MLFTRRSRERRLSAVLAALSATALVSVTSCSSNDDPAAGQALPDAASDAVDGGDASDAADAAITPREPIRSDAGPMEIECASAACATALSTTLGVPLYPGEQPGEGFCALLHDGTVACWGQNTDGQLGQPSAANARNRATAERVEGLSNIVKLGHSCAVDRDGAAWCWGSGPFLRDELAARTVERAPVKLPLSNVGSVDFNVSVDFDAFIDLATGCAIVDGALRCWGTNEFGLVDVPRPGESRTTPLPPRTLDVPAGAPIRDVLVGNASFVLRDDGTLLSWGANPPLGRVSSLSPDPYPKPVLLEHVVSVDVGGDNVCATAEGIGYCWGLSQSSADSLSRALPEPLPLPEPVVQIATAPTPPPEFYPRSPHRGCAAGVSGAVYCWGNNTVGQAGDGTTKFAMLPVKVEGLPGPAARVKVTQRTSCAVLKTGQVFCWGDNYSGQLGRPPLKEPSPVPIEVVLP